MNLKKIRIKNELLQKDIAKSLGVAQCTYATWEKEINPIPLKRLNDFCNLFDVSLDYALGITNIEKYPNMKKNIDFALYSKRIKKVRKLYGYTQQEIANILNTDNSVISRYENEKNLMLTSFLVEYVKLFDISADYLTGRLDEELSVHNRLILL